MIGPNWFQIHVVKFNFKDEVVNAKMSESSEADDYGDDYEDDYSVESIQQKVNVFPIIFAWNIPGDFVRKLLINLFLRYSQ